MGAAHGRSGPHRDHSDDDDHDDTHDDGDHDDGDDDADHVTHVADVHHTARTGAVPDPRSAPAGPGTCAGSVARTCSGAVGDARTSDAVIGPMRADGYTGVP